MDKIKNIIIILIILFQAIYIAYMIYETNKAIIELKETIKRGDKDA